MVGSRTVPIVGGVLDGDSTRLPAGAEEGFMARLHTKECGEKTPADTPCRCTQSSDYTLRKEGSTEAMVAQGMKWPFLTGAAA